MSSKALKCPLSFLHHQGVKLSTKCPLRSPGSSSWTLYPPGDDDLAMRQGVKVSTWDTSGTKTNSWTLYPALDGAIHELYGVFHRIGHVISLSMCAPQMAVSGRKA